MPCCCSRTPHFTNCVSLYSSSIPREPQTSTKAYGTTTTTASLIADLVTDTHLCNSLTTDRYTDGHHESMAPVSGHNKSTCKCGPTMNRFLPLVSASHQSVRDDASTFRGANICALISACNHSPTGEGVGTCAAQPYSRIRRCRHFL